MGAGGGLRILVPKSVCMARPGYGDRYVRGLAGLHVSPKLCRSECWVRLQVFATIPNNAGREALHIGYSQVTHGREMLV